MAEQKEIIEAMRGLLEQLEREVVTEDRAVFLRNFDALEMPAIVAAVVDYLQPLLLPYEATIYWYLLRQSVLRSGQQHARTSVTELKQRVISSARSSQTTLLSPSAVTDALRGLENKGAIVRAGETTREGTLYKVCLPEEISICHGPMQKAAEAAISIAKPVDEAKDLDYYNVAGNRAKVFERDAYLCHYCRKQLTRFSATLDHIQPVSHGGDNSIGNLTTACLHCNSSRRNLPVMDSIVEREKNDA